MPERWMEVGLGFCTRLVGKRENSYTQWKKVGNNIFLIISLFLHLVNVLWRGTGTKSVQDFLGGEKKMVRILNPDSFLSRFSGLAAARNVELLPIKAIETPTRDPS